MITLISLAELRPHEKTLKQHAKRLLKEITQDGTINIPILIDKKTRVILDGHHRYTVAKLLKLAKIPCFEVDYFDDRVISISSWRKKIMVTKEDVIAAATSGFLFPHKTTRHTLLVPYSSVPTPLTQLLS